MHVFRPVGVTGILPCIYHIHGGGYVMGKVSDYDPLVRPLIADLQCVMVSVEYRLAPETNFPGPIEDCYAGLAWTIAHAEDLGIDPTRLGVMGQSAGGGYAAALALMVRDRGEYALAFQHLIYPMLDDRTCTAPPHPYAGEFVWTGQSNRFGWSSLLGHGPGGDDVSPYAAPARATDLGNLPRTYIATGALDLFVDEDIDYATRLIRAGVPVELHVYPGGYHAFDVFADGPVSQQARRDSHEALRRALA
ncbi:alpha/beta hydrolase [Sphingomonas sp. LR59]|uniref:alpha/beta hydrolase n=1 Tax=Sphingomonas sp. LR59 TaxID=3050232 RepID=UPI002FE38B35